jgi:hypothetical protein
VPFETLLKHSLLITHGTIYGEVFLETVHHTPPDITDNILTIWNAAKPGNVDFPFIQGAVTPTMSSSITHNEPVDIVHWDAGPGSASSSGMFPWEQCAVLLVRL